MDITINLVKVIFTREHGAYGMAITSFVIGAGVAGAITLQSITTLSGVILLIMAKYPLSLLLQRRNLDAPLRKSAFFWSFVFLHSGFLFFLPLLKSLKLDMVIFAVLFAGIHAALYFLAVLFRKERTIFVEVLGISALSVAGFLGYLASGGKDKIQGLFIWFIPLLYYTASIFKVRSIVDRERQEFFGLLNTLYPFLCAGLLALFSIADLFRISVLFCLLPLLENLAFVLKKERVDIRKVGWTEVLKSAVFGIILIFTLR